MGVYKGIAQDNVTINSGTATLQTLTVTGALTASGGVTGPVRLPVAAVAAAGNNQGTAAALSEGLNVVSAADGTKGVRLPTAVAGAVVIVKNTVAASLKIYPASGAAVNAVAANGSYDITNLTSTMLVASSATQWYSVPLVAS
jgi:hypothetical protein